MKNTRKLLSIILAVLMIATTVPFAFAADIVKSGDCGANGGNVKWTLDSDGTLTISGTGDMQNFATLAKRPWYGYTNDIKKIIIEDGVTSMANYTAYGCFFATSISIGKDVKSIGPIYTTFYCRDLETITVSEDNEYYKSVDNVLFSKDGKELLKVACKAFSGTYNIPDGVVKINKMAFDRCPYIEKVVLPDSVEEIGEDAFYQCQSLKILDIGMAKLSSVGEHIFANINTPVEVIADKDNEYVSVVNGSFFSKIDGTLFYAQITDDKCVVPYGVKIIPEYTIELVGGSVVVPDTVETIEIDGIMALDSVVHYLGTESQFQEIYEGHISDFEWYNVSMHYCVQQGNISASCTDDEVTEWYCLTCDETIKYVTGYALGHDIVEVDAKAPTCTETGLTAGQHCSRCDAMTIAQEVVPALNHKDTLVKVDAKAPTCTEIGWDAYEYCTACDYSTYTEKAALNHKDTLVQVEAKAPTCTEIGWDAYEYCTACDYTTYAEKAALDHDIVIDAYVAPKCEETGLTAGQHCSRCDDMTIVQEVIPDLGGHINEDGNTTCDRCGETILCEDCGRPVHDNTFIQNLICLIIMLINLVKSMFA